MRIAPVCPDQHESLVDLLCELYAYYNRQASVTRDVVRAHLLDNLLAPDSAVRLIVAEDGAHGIAGFAAVVLLHSLVDPTPANRRQCMVKELYVRSGRRSAGVGRALMAWVARYAVDQGCGRIDWHVQASNRAGIRFYAGLGAEPVEGRLNYRLRRPVMEALAASRLRASDEPPEPLLA
jgi:GNAT superfamily N-acetyltransferase